MDYFGYNDIDEFMTFVRDVCLVLLGVFLGTVVWLMWDKLTAPREPEEEPYVGPAEPQQRLVDPPEAQQQVDPAEAQQQVDPAEAQQQVDPVAVPPREPAGEPDPRVHGPAVEPGQQVRGEYGTPDEIRERLHNWMREEIVQGLRRDDEEARQQREREHQEELRRNRDQILEDLREAATRCCEGTHHSRRSMLPPGALPPTTASSRQSATSHDQRRSGCKRVPRVRPMSRMSWTKRPSEKVRPCTVV